MALGFSTAVPSLGDLAGSVGSIVDSVVGDLLDTITGNTKFNKLFDQSESNFKQYSEEVTDVRQWTTVPTDTSSPSYFFLLKYRGKVLQIPFNINPQRETVSEPNASTTVFTQGGGKVIQGEGMISKDITIQGTCGLYPNERRTRLPDSGIGSGLEGFKFLQNVFRRYCFLRRFGDLTNGLQLIYVNRRRQESWVVEPKAFTSEDATEHNFYFNYTIVLETLYPYDGKDAKGLIEGLFDSIPGWRQADAIIQRLSETVDVVNASVGQISSIVNGFGATIFSRVVALANSFADVKAGRLPNLSNFKRDSVKSIVGQLADTHRALETAGQKDLAVKIAQLQRATTATLIIDNVFETSPQDKASQTTTIQRNQVSNFNDGQGTAVSPTDAIAAGAVTQRPDSSVSLGGKAIAPAALPGTATKQAQDQAAIGNDPTRTISTVGGSSLDPNGKFQVTRFVGDAAQLATAIPPSTRVIESQLNWDASWDGHLTNIDPQNSDYRTQVVNNGDSIQTLAFRVLGESARWPELVLLNDLRYPYIADQSYIEANNLTNVIAYGKTIIFPVPKQVATTKTRNWRNETFESLALSPIERAYGNDILIDETTGDAVWGPNDLSLVYGVNNLSQFMRFRVVTKKGTYRRSPRIGFSDYVGLSAGVTGAIVRAEAEALFFDDDRITQSQAVVIRQVAQVLEVGIAAFVRDAQDPVILTQSL